MKPSERVEQIYSETMERIRTKPNGDWVFMLDDEKDKTKLAVQIAAIKEYLDEQATLPSDKEG